MLTIFEKILIGHLIGDYLLQSKKMAIMKTVPELSGYIWCILHSVIYTIAICIFVFPANPLIILFIFLSHFPVDRWSLAAKWLKLIKGRSIKDAFRSTENRREIDLSFSVLVYTIVDNTIHLLLIIMVFTWC
ncbi:MAG: DUF3307 domain-containing protein [Candidatus Falkowbacteria bacterium]|nr:DUF3307 domain-containing protein [Candidatus Falkowbacteria bacterium]